VNPYNVLILSFPNSILSGYFGFKELLYYKSDPGADKAPKVNFILKKKREKFIFSL
jgi:LemA protein